MLPAVFLSLLLLLLFYFLFASPSSSFVLFFLLLLSTSTSFFLSFFFFFFFLFVLGLAGTCMYRVELVNPVKQKKPSCLGYAEATAAPAPSSSSSSRGSSRARTVTAPRLGPRGMLGWRGDQQQSGELMCGPVGLQRGCGRPPGARELYERGARPRLRFIEFGCGKKKMTTKELSCRERERRRRKRRRRK